MDKRWVVADRLDPDLIQHLLKLQQFKTEDERRQFFTPSLVDLTSPWDFPEMDRAVERIDQAIEAKEKIVVWGDFDADGVCSTAVLWEVLHQLGGDVLPYIPNRDSEGHGFSEVGLQKLAGEGTKLLITVDHGITAFEGINRAKELGMEVIVTDHHEPLEQEERGTPPADERDEKYRFPDAVAVIHPFRLERVQMLAGCGTAYMLAYAVWLKLSNKDDSVETRQIFGKDRLELVALGTVADLMPLNGDNRIFVQEGLRQLATTLRLGLKAMYDVAGLVPKESVSIYEVGFVLGPRLNAPGRLADALESLRLLCTKDPKRAKQLAQDLDRLNKERQELLIKVSRAAQEKVSQRPGEDAYVLVDPYWPAGVCGLAAGRLVEQVYRPVVVMEEQGELSRGSARSIKGFDITLALTSMSELLETYGGHAMAAGFVARTENVPEIERRLGEAVREQLSSDRLQPELLIAAEVRLEELDGKVWDFLKTLEPCGMGNPQPVLAGFGWEVTDCKTVGSDKKHLKLTLSASAESLDKSSEKMSTAAMDAIAFGFGYLCDDLQGQKVDVAFNLDENVWNGKKSLQLKVKDMKLRKDYSPSLVSGIVVES